MAKSSKYRRGIGEIKSKTKIKDQVAKLLKDSDLSHYIRNRRSPEFEVKKLINPQINSNRRN